MTNEQKLTKLLQIAVENGWENDLYQNHIMKHDLTLYPDILQLQHSEEEFEFLTSLNDLVLNWEEGQVSFLDALCKSKEEDLIDYYPQYGMTHYENWYVVELRMSWTILPTAKRLEYLFAMFQHLL